MTNPLNSVQEGIVGMKALQDPSRSREEGRAQGKTGGKSQAPSVDALEPRMTMLKTVMFAAHDTLDGLEKKVDGSRENTPNSHWQQRPSSKTKRTPSEGSFEPFTKSCRNSVVPSKRNCELTVLGLGMAQARTLR